MFNSSASFLISEFKINHADGDEVARDYSRINRSHACKKQRCKLLSPSAVNCQSRHNYITIITS